MDQLPCVTIVVPAKNEAQHLPLVFDALNALDYPRDRCDIVVVDNGSSDATAALARARGARVIAAPGVRVGEVRNAGARVARGEILAFVDADCLVAASWLSAAVALLKDARIGAVGGSCLAPRDGNWVARAWVLEDPSRDADAESLATSSFIMRRATFDELGGFDASLGAGEDDDLSRRVRAVGLRLYREPECAVVHLGYPSTLGGVLRRQMWHGRSQLHAASLEPMLILTHAFAASALVVAPYAVLVANAALAFIALFATGMLAALPAMAKERKVKPFSALRLVQRVTVYWFFFLGRSLGLLLNYRDLLGRVRQLSPLGEREP
jgi:glycosyltransferase involved in cell wall biosynthesis